jgi:hypothetical protein
MSKRSLGRVVALSAIMALGVAACSSHEATDPAVPLEPVATAPAPIATTTTVTTGPLGTTTTTVPVGTSTTTFVPPLSAPAAPRGTVTTVPTTPFGQTVVVQNTGAPVAYPPVYTPPTAIPRGVAFSDPSQYVTTSTVSVSGTVTAISAASGSFLLQTPTEGWTVVLPVGASAPSVATGRRVTVSGYAHRTERNQLLATAVSPWREPARPRRAGNPVTAPGLRR